MPEPLIPERFNMFAANLSRGAQESHNPRDFPLQQNYPLQAPLKPYPSALHRAPYARHQGPGNHARVSCFICAGPHYQSHCPTRQGPTPPGLQAIHHQFHPGHPPRAPVTPAVLNQRCPLPFHGGHFLRHCRVLLVCPCPLPFHRGHLLNKCKYVLKPRTRKPPPTSYPHGYHTSHYPAPPYCLPDPLPSYAPVAPVVINTIYLGTRTPPDSISVPAPISHDLAPVISSPVATVAPTLATMQDGNLPLEQFPHPSESFLIDGVPLEGGNVVHLLLTRPSTHLSFLHMTLINPPPPPPTLDVVQSTDPDDTLFTLNTRFDQLVGFLLTAICFRFCYNLFFPGSC